MLRQIWKTKRKTILHNRHKYKPETNLRLTSDNLYPDPSNSNSIPDKVVPSQLNCVLIVAGVLGPFEISILALNDPTPLFSECCESSVNFHRHVLFSDIL